MDMKTPVQKMTLTRVATLNLLAYLLSYLLVPYRTAFVGVTLHTLILLVGISLWVLASRGEPGALSIWRTDRLVLGLLIVTWVISIAFSGRPWSSDYAYAHAVGFISFVFVYLTARHVNHDIVYWVLALYCIASFPLFALQVYIGPSFYVSEYLGGKVDTWFGTGFISSSGQAGLFMMWIVVILGSRLSVASMCRAGWLIWAGLVAGAAGIAFSLSRSALLGTVVGLLAIGLLLKAHNARLHRWALVIILAVFSISLAFSLPSTITHYKNSKLAFLSENPELTDTATASGLVMDASTNTRLELWKVAVRAWKEAPIWGIGMGEFPSFYSAHLRSMSAEEKKVLDKKERHSPHNSYLEWAVELGVFPFVALLTMIGIVLKRGVGTNPRSNAFPYVIGFISICVWIFFNDYLRDRLFWIALAIAASLTVPRSEVSGTEDWSNIAGSTDA